MVNSEWFCYGASVQGPGHKITDTPNQDAWDVVDFPDFTGLLVSDGVGSCENADKGSHAACFGAAGAIHNILKTGYDRRRFVETIHHNYLSGLRGLEPLSCLATCLFGVRLGDGYIHLGMLGDGLAAVLLKNGTVSSLLDDKALVFSNIVRPLGPTVDFSDWMFMDIPEEQCKAVFLCTDGVADDFDDGQKRDEFVRGYLEYTMSRPCELAALDTVEMLTNWPVPKHTDDKTIACMYRKEDADGRRRG